MNIHEQLLQEHSKAQTERIVEYIGHNKERLEELMHLFLGHEALITQRAAWVVGYVGEHHPQLMSPYLKGMIENLKKDVHAAVKRNTLRVLQGIDIPEDLMGELADTCFDLLSEAEEPVAIKVFSMVVLYNMALKEPDLKNELKILIEEQMPFASPGFQSRGKKVLRALEKIK